MARKQAHPLFMNKKVWDVTKVDDGSWDPRMTDPCCFSALHDPNVTYTGLCATAAKAVLELLKGDDSNIAVVEIAQGSYAAEMQRSDGSKIIIYYPQSGKPKAAIVHASGRYENVKAIGSSHPYDEEDLIVCMALVLMKAIATIPEVHDDFEELKNIYSQTKKILRAETYRISDALYYGVSTNQIKFIVTGGNIDMLTEQSVNLGAFKGKVLFGQPKILENKTNHVVSGSITFGKAKEKFKDWAKKVSERLTEKEKKLIPEYEDDDIVPPEALKIANFFVASTGSKTPMVNFGIRGITGYGKSTAVKMMAGFLGMPHVVITCDPQMERQDFLSMFVPNTGSLTGNLPSFEEIRYAPEDAYETMTGEYKDGITSDEVFELYTEAVRNEKNPDNNRYKLVESNYIRALYRGYVVEVQEFSVPKNPGTLVSINEYDRPGSIIPLADGSTTVRHPEALVVFTDNVGYAGRRPVDQSVLRRMSIIFDVSSLPKEKALERVRKNTGFADESLLETMYSTWEMIQEHCKDKDISDGSVSLVELENWAKAVIIDGYQNVYENALSCVISKATAQEEDQMDLISSVLAVQLQAN